MATKNELKSRVTEAFLRQFKAALALRGETMQRVLQDAAAQYVANAATAPASLVQVPHHGSTPSDMLGVSDQEAPQVAQLLAIMRSGSELEREAMTAVLSALSHDALKSHEQLAAIATRGYSDPTQRTIKGQKDRRTQAGDKIA